MATALIIGASRGIGHELVKQYLADGWRVIATARKADDCAALGALGAEPHLLDVTDADAYAAIGAQLGAEQLHVAILNAGVYGPREDGVPSSTDFDNVMHTNVLAAMRLLPLLAPAVGAARGKLAVLSSKMGSLSERSSPSGSLYRASKAALNSVLIDTALVFGKQGATCVAFHPGWVRTDMGGGGADLPVEESARGIRATLAALPASDRAVYRSYDGTPIGW
jgi:NAD(P)-dependent dehydrogenase (short-subunit alcohol dehydrogenase family)